MRRCVMRTQDGCTGLVLLDCPKNCRFFKTLAGKAASMWEGYDRIARLPIDDQRYIANKYYKGQMPWLRRQEGR